MTDPKKRPARKVPAKKRPAAKNKRASAGSGPAHRPTKCTPDRIERIAAAIRGANYENVAAGVGGISERTYYEWKARGRLEQERLQLAEDHLDHEEPDDGCALCEAGAKRVAAKPNPAEAPYLTFFEEVSSAIVESEAILVTRWQKHSLKDYRAARDLLARRFGDRWMERQGRELTGPAGGPVVTESTVMPPADQDARTAEAIAALVEAGVLPPEALEALAPPDEPDEDAGAD